MSDQSDARRDSINDVGRLIDKIIDHLGLSMSTIAAACDVHRRDVYDWVIDEAAPTLTSKQRETLRLLERLSQVCADAKHVLARRWSRAMSDRDDKTLCDVITAEVIDEARALDLVAELVRRSILWSEQRERRLASSLISSSSTATTSRALDAIVRPISSERTIADTDTDTKKS